MLQQMIKAYLLYADAEGHSHVKTGRIQTDIFINANKVYFRETPAHGAFEWHNAPTTQYVLTLDGVLEFVTSTGEQFTLRPGDVLVATDTSGKGHQWQLVGDAPWKRVYVTFDAGTDPHFLED